MTDKSKNIVVAGGLGLLGQEFSKAVAQEYNKVIIFDQNGTDRWRKLDVPGDYFDVDITDTANIDKTIDHLHRSHGPVDAFINTAYPRNKNYGKHYFDVTFRDFSENLSLHLGGYFLIAQRFARYFKEQNYGNIINVASVQGVVAPKFSTYQGTDMTTPVEYSVIKSGLIHLSKYMAKYLKDTGIRVNCISPGGILDGQPEPFLARYRDECINIGMLQPHDLNSTILFLLSDSSRAVNGQNIIVDDGFTL